MSTQSDSTDSRCDTCCVCFKANQSEDTNPIRNNMIRCGGCCQIAHRFCYSPSATTTQILCDSCKEAAPVTHSCVICEQSDGLLKKIDSNKFGHVICLMFSPFFLVKSYRMLQFVEIRSVKADYQKFCDICHKLGNPVNLAICSLGDCGRRCHWRCLLKHSTSGLQGWVHSLWYINEQQKICMRRYFNLFQAHLNQYFDGLFEQKTIIISQNNLIVSRNCEIYCPKHRQLYEEDCHCQKQTQQKMVFCDYCQAWNHVKCQKIMKSLPEKYKCVQCQNWELLIKYRRKPLLEYYPKLHLYDFVYIHSCFEQQKYRVTQNQYELITRMPTPPSLHFYPKFVELHFYPKLSQEIKVISFLKQNGQIKQRWGRNKPENIKSLKLIKILLAQYDELQTLRYDLISKKEDLKLAKQENVKVLLKMFKQFQKRCVKLKDFVVSINRESIQQSQIRKLKNSASKIKFQDIHQQVKSEQSQNKTQSQETRSIQYSQVQYQKLNISSKKLNKTIMTHCNKKAIHNQPNSIDTNEQNIQIRNNSIVKENTQKQNNRDTEYRIIKEIKKQRMKGNKQLIDIQRNIELMGEQKQKKQKNSLVIEDDQIICKRLLVKCLQLDLTDRMFRIERQARKNILQQLNQPGNKQGFNDRQQNVIFLQSQMCELLEKMQWNNGDIRDSEPPNYIEDLSKCKLSYQNIGYFFKCLSRCRRKGLMRYSLICESLATIGQKMISCNTKQSIKNEQQVEAYETIVSSLGVRAQWVEHEIEKKRHVDEILEGLKLDGGQMNAIMCTHILNQTISYCSEHKMSYMMGKLQQKLHWYKIYNLCCSTIPRPYLEQDIEGLEQAAKLEVSVVAELWQLMIKHQFPDTRLRQIVNYYYNKYTNQARLAVDLLQILDNNIKHSQPSTFRFSMPDIVQCVKTMECSLLDHSHMINQIKEVLYIYEHLKAQLLTHQQLTVQVRENLATIDVIPIVFAQREQVIAKPSPVSIVEVSSNLVEVSSSEVEYCT